MSALFQRLGVPARGSVRQLCTPRKTYECKLLVVGAGVGGCSTAWRLAPTLKNSIIVLEPSQVHYYQPDFTLVAAGVKQLNECCRPTYSILPDHVPWVNDAAEHFDPCNNTVYTHGGCKIHYEYMVVAVGIKNDYDVIPGLRRALEDPKCKVSTIYSPTYCQKTWCLLEEFCGGHALFTFPRIAGKCAGSSLKITYLAHDYWTTHKLIDQTSLCYNTAHCEIFGVPKYSDMASKLMKDRNIAVNHNTELVEVGDHSATFKSKSGKPIVFPYNFLHVTPPMSPPACLSTCEKLLDESGFLSVDHHTLQHKVFPNVYGLGDCTCTPNSKTASAVGPQSSVVAINIMSSINGKTPTAQYNGYGACPILTSFHKGILAEYIYDKKPWQTFPFDQIKERRFFHHLYKYVFPHLYWNHLLKGKWNGPMTLRKFINPFKR